MEKEKVEGEDFAKNLLNHHSFHSKKRLKMYLGACFLTTFFILTILSYLHQCILLSPSRGLILVICNKFCDYFHQIPKECFWMTMHIDSLDGKILLDRYRENSSSQSGKKKSHNYKMSL